MSFKGFVCWDPARVGQVMHTDAEAAVPAVFMAVHTDEPLELQRPEGRRSAREFLDDFLAASGDVRAVVIGDSGSGKSHLVRWVELNLPADRADLCVVSVPRSGTSLRWIVRRLIDVLPEELQSDYRDKLVAAPDSPARFNELELRLLTQLALALERFSDGDEVDVGLAAGLSAFFLDPQMRKHHTGQTGIVADLVRHITSPSGREDRDTRRRFEESDLHLDSALTNLRDFSAPTVTILRLLQSDRPLRDRAVRLVNNHLDAAVAQTLGLGAVELTELLSGIRQHLKGQNQTLVLLVEDFVRTEGIDRALLDALIDSSDDLCDLRLLIAVTTGYYDRELLETQKTRLHYIINLDHRHALDEGDRLAPFVARYLNALRAEGGALERWYDESRSGEFASPLPNRCTGCEHREPCHTAFGSRSLDGLGRVGLYPFTDQALANMARRFRQRSSEELAVDPRSVLRDVLSPVAENRRARALAEGNFPDANLVANHGGAELPLHVQEQVRSQSRDNAERYLALLELWSAHPGEVTELPNGIYGAFSLDPLQIDGAHPSQVAELDEPYQVAQPTRSLPQTVQQRLDVIGAWHNGGPMTYVIDALRGLVSNAVTAAIDWDGEGLERAVFAGGRAGRARDSFRRTSINFTRQDTTELPGAVKLRLPLSDDAEAQLRTARALEGLVNFDHYGHWRFAQGHQQLLAVSEEVPLWAEHVTAQLQRLHDPEQEWDPTASAIELLAVGAALASRPPQVDASIPERLAAILDERWPDPGNVEVRSDLWRALYQRIHASRSDLRELVLAHASAMKGGQSGSMLEASRVTQPLRVLRRHWRLRAIPPARLAAVDLPSRYQRLIDLHAHASQALPDAVEDELVQRLEWLDELRTYMPEGVMRHEVIESVERLLHVIDSEGISVRNEYRRDLMDALGPFRTVQLDEAIRMTDELRDTKRPAQSLLPRLAGERRANAMRAWTEFREPLVRFLDDAESKTLSAKEKIGGADMIEHQYDRVQTAFTALEEDLSAVVDP